MITFMGWTVTSIVVLGLTLWFGDKVEQAFKAKESAQ